MNKYILFIILFNTTIFMIDLFDVPQYTIKHLFDKNYLDNTIQNKFIIYILLFITFFTLYYFITV